VRQEGGNGGTGQNGGTGTKNLNGKDHRELSEYKRILLKWVLKGYSLWRLSSLFNLLGQRPMMNFCKQSSEHCRRLRVFEKNIWA
jgi:hypothetical protein